MVKLFSIKQIYSDKIFSKEKFVEFRRQNVNIKKNEKCLIYTSHPVKKITGYFVVKEKIRLPIEKLWSKTKYYAGLTKYEFMKYFEGCKEGTAIFLHSVKKFMKGISIYELKSLFKNFKPPQSYYNLDEHVFIIILKKLNFKPSPLLYF